MASKSYMKSHYKDKLKHGAHPIYWEVSRSVAYPVSSTKQDSKKYTEFNSCGRMTIGKVK